MAKRAFDPALYQQLNDALTNSSISERQNRLLAVVALFQAAQLTYLLAAQGKNALQGISAQALVSLLDASLTIKADASASLFSLDVFGGLEHLQIGFRSLEGSLAQPYQNTRSRMPMPRQYSESFRYAMALIQLEKKVYKKPVFVQQITSEQANIQQRLNFFDHNMQHPAILASLANLYVNTAGQLTPRLSVRGKPEYLKQQATIDAIRACLFSGLQAAHFWRQLGGTRWQLIFGRKAMLEDLRYLASLRYQNTPRESLF
ncbi:lysogenization protein HflD [Alkanindiges sp. WGS2144]|uniref:lysogenization protein HflD n=1 Tax=Alkanindiges sp. WGS2144 TaxID=3366808 RepID=UPI003752CAE1